MVAGAIAVMERGANQHAQICAPSQTEAAEMLNVSRRSVQAAKKVIDEGVPELRQAVEKGEVSVSAAAKVAELPKAEQRKAVKHGKVAELAKPEKPAKSSEVEQLQAEVNELSSRLRELADQQEPLQDEVTFLRQIESEGDKLAAALAEVKRLQAVVRGQEERIRGLQNEKNEAVRAAKGAA
jgi:DNA repair exonuclease SbcCD ATPase subunit